MILKDTSAVITGGTGGLGRRIALKLAQAGVRITLVYLRSKAAAEQFAEELTALGPRAVAVKADITTEEGIDVMFARTMEEFGRLDILVNNAAYNRWISFSDLETLSGEVWSHMINYNLTAPFLAMRAAAPLMRRHSQGRIVNITSGAGLAPVGSSIAYATSKAGLIHLSRCMAVALAPEILVNNVAPGTMTGTRMAEKMSPEQLEKARLAAALKRVVDKDDVADAVLTLIRTDSITGSTLVVDAGKLYH